MKVTLERTHGAQFRCLSEEGRELWLSGSEDIGPSERGMRPMQAVLAALAGCSSVDVLNILQRGRGEVTALHVTVEGTRADAIPAVFTKVHVHFEAAGDFSEHKLQRAVQLSMEKYCSVTKMLEPTVEVTHSWSLGAEASA
jgi:putative redox protein